VAEDAGPFLVLTALLGRERRLVAGLDLLDQALEAHGVMTFLMRMIPKTNPMIQSVSGITKKKSTWPNFSRFSAMIPMPAAPIPDWAMPVPMSPPAIAMPAASTE